MVSVLILLLIYRKVDFGQLKDILTSVSALHFSIYILLFIPQIALAAFRWRYILSRISNYPVSYLKSFQMVVGSYSANLIIPAKMGEVVRVFWVDKSKSKYKPFALVIFEKMWDILVVYLIFYIAFIFVQFHSEKFREAFYIFSAINAGAVMAIILFALLKKKIPLAGNNKMSEILNSIREFWHESKSDFPVVFIWSIVLWIVQVSQFYFMFRAFNVILPVDLVFSGSALSVLAGAVIISIGGVGPRDATIIWFFASLVSKEILVSVGIISVLRIVVPAIVGLPFFIKLSVQKQQK